jgi:hypothetical protein
MKSAYVLSEDSRLFEVAREVLEARGGSAVDDVAQFRGLDGFLLTIYRDEYPGDNFRTEPFTSPEGSGDIPPIADMHAVTVECRSERLLIDVVQSVAAAAERPVWVLDNESVLWPANDLDPVTLSL